MAPLRPEAVTSPADPVRARLLRWVDGDDDAILGAEALKEVGRLLLVPDLDIDQARLGGLLLWYRDTDDDLVSALAMLARVWRADPVRLPPEISGYFAEFVAGTIRPTDAWQGP